MTRLEAISGRTVGAAKLWMGQTHVAAGHQVRRPPPRRGRDRHLRGVGHPAFVFAEGDEEVRLEAGPGDYIFVPPYVPHREENPGAEEAVVVIARSSQEGVVVNLPSLWAPVHAGTQGGDCAPAEPSDPADSSDDPAGRDGA